MRGQKRLIPIGLAAICFIATPIQTRPRTIVADYESETQPTIEVETPQQVTIEAFKSIIQEEVIETIEEVTEETQAVSKSVPTELLENWIDINIHISYYTGLACENSIYGAVDAQGNPLRHGTLAIPRDLPLGTKFKIDNHDTMFTGTDRGSKKYIKWIDANTLKVDMYIPRNKGETDSAYYQRVNNMGITKTKGSYLLPKE